MRSRGKIIIWPSYLEGTLSRSDGRRIPKSLARRDVIIEEIYRAAQELGLNPELQKNASHPRTPWRKTGLIMVDKRMPKTRLLRELARKIR
jgi:signal recognition particle subunit SRP19